MPIANGTTRRTKAADPPAGADKRFAKLARVKAAQDRKLATAAVRRRLFVECGANAGLIDLIERAREFHTRLEVFAKAYPPDYFRKLHKRAGVEADDAADEFNPKWIHDSEAGDFEFLNSLATFIGDKGHLVAFPPAG